MKTQVLGVKRMHGIGKDSGNEYDMASLFVIVPIEPVNKETLKIEGYGYETGELQVEPKALKQFEGFKYPCALELTLEPILYKGKISQIVTGTTSVPPVKSVSYG